MLETIPLLSPPLHWQAALPLSLEVLDQSRSMADLTSCTLELYARSLW